MLKDYMLEVFFFRPPEDNHIIQIDDAIGQVELSQCILHQMLEGCGHVTQSKGHPGKFIEAQVTNREGSVLLQLWSNTNLPESTIEIHCGEVGSSSHALGHFLYPG